LTPLPTGGRFAEENFNLTLDASSAFYGFVYFRAETLTANLYQTDRARVTVCGDQQISVADPLNQIFDITLIGDGNADWISFATAGAFKTQSSILPLNECPVTAIQVCLD
jgi:hypothetical protein